MIVVSDTSCINYLVLIGAIEVLETLYGTVIIPHAVQSELLSDSTPDAVYEWISNAPEWLEVHKAGNLIEFEKLDQGEREAISLALQLNADVILLDEKRGRLVATEQGLAVTGTLGVLATAAREGLLSLSEAFEKLKQTSYRANDALYDSILEQERLKSIASD